MWITVGIASQGCLSGVCNGVYASQGCLSGVYNGVSPGVYNGVSLGCVQRCTSGVLLKGELYLRGVAQGRVIPQGVVPTVVYLRVWSYRGVPQGVEGREPLIPQGVERGEPLIPQGV